jgi:hypothetical protein
VHIGEPAISNRRIIDHTETPTAGLSGEWGRLNGEPSLLEELLDLADQPHAVLLEHHRVGAFAQYHEALVG